MSRKKLKEGLSFGVEGMWKNHTWKWDEGSARSPSIPNSTTLDEWWNETNNFVVNENHDVRCAKVYNLNSSGDQYQWDLYSFRCDPSLRSLYPDTYGYHVQDWFAKFFLKMPTTQSNHLVSLWEERQNPTVLASALPRSFQLML